MKNNPLAKAGVFVMTLTLTLTLIISSFTSLALSAAESLTDSCNSLSSNQDNSLNCIQNQWDNDPYNVELYGLSGINFVNKQVVKEVLKVGLENGIAIQNIKLVIALHASLSLANNWKETNSDICYGISRLCNDGPNSNYTIATQNLEVASPLNYINTPALQMKSLDNLIKSKQESLNNIPNCMVPKLDSKSEEYKILYIWNNTNCDDNSAYQDITKDEFATKISNNIPILSCLDFLIQDISNVTLEDRTFNQIEDVIQNAHNTNLLNIESNAVNGYYQYTPYKPVSVDNFTPEECRLLKRYMPYIIDGLARYGSTSFPNLSIPIVAGMLYEETHFGLVDMRNDQGKKGCNGRGDKREAGPNAPYGAGFYGHGLGQADPSSENVPKKVSWSYGEQIKIKRQGFNDTYSWDDCRGGIMYLIGHTFDVAEAANVNAVAKIKNATQFNTKRYSNGYFESLETQGTYTNLMLIAHNAGATGMLGCSVNKGGVVRETCSAHGNYASRVLKSAINAAKCLGKKITINEILKGENVYIFKY